MCRATSGTLSTGQAVLFLDGDEEVTLFDFGVLVRNFGAIGDE
jgi:hypothetical protein